MPRRNPRRNPTDDDPKDDDPNSNEDEGNTPGDASLEDPNAIGAVLRAVLDRLKRLEERLEGPRREETEQQDDGARDASTYYFSLVTRDRDV